MSSFLIKGKGIIEGQVRISGNKNAALACIFATLLTDEPVTISNVPLIEDVKVAIQIVRELGRKVTAVVDGVYRFEGSDLKNNVSKELVGLARGTILLAGAFVGRGVDLRLPPPGGDVIGQRRLDSHFQALRQLGARCEIDDEGFLSFHAPHLEGASIFLDEASVTATENAIMAASLAEGDTTIYNAACEPHVQDLCRMLSLMGCRMTGIGSNLLCISGSRKLGGCDFTLGFDYMEAGSFIGLAAAAKGEVELLDVDIRQIEVFFGGFEKLGVRYVKTGPSSILIPRRQSRLIRRSIDGRTIKIDDAPWPGFPTDVLSIITVAATQMKGTALIHEKMFESRMYFVDYLIRMGADIIQCDPHRVLVAGPSELVASRLISPDVRAGMALVTAALCASGESEIQNIYQIERGYENLEQKLKALGADIRRVD